MTERGRVLEAAAMYAARAGEKLRAQGLSAEAVHQFHGSRSMRLVLMTDLDAAWRDGFLYVKAGVILDDLRPRTEAPACLFGAARPGSAALTAAVDELSARYRRHAVFPAAMGVDRPWRLRAAHHSPRCTTRIAELPIARAWQVLVGVPSPFLPLGSLNPDY